MVGSGTCFLAARREYVGAEKLQELATRMRNTSAPPLADAWRTDLAKARYSGCSAEAVNDFGVLHAL